MIAWRLEHHVEIASTSDLCSARAREGAPEGLAITAERQTAGRGSRGRTWQAPAGNLALSLLLRPHITPPESSVYPLLAGIAVADALVPLLPSPTPMLKWPNDILLNDAKLAGLLIDAAPQSNRIEWLVIGIGMNIAQAPNIPGRQTTSLAAHGVTIPPAEMAEEILNRINHWLDVFAAQGAPAIHAAWLKRAHPLGTPLEVRTPQTATAGHFAGLSPTGELLLQVENRIETFQTGEILLA